MYTCYKCAQINNENKSFFKSDIHLIKLHFYYYFLYNSKCHKYDICDTGNI